MGTTDEEDDMPKPSAQSACLIQMDRRHTGVQLDSAGLPARSTVPARRRRERGTAVAINADED